MWLSSIESQKNAPRLYVFLGSTEECAVPELKIKLGLLAPRHAALWETGKPGRHLPSSQAQEPVLSSANGQRVGQRPPESCPCRWLPLSPDPEHTELV